MSLSTEEVISLLDMAGPACAESFNLELEKIGFIRLPAFLSGGRRGASLLEGLRPATTRTRTRRPSPRSGDLLGGLRTPPPPSGAVTRPIPRRTPGSGSTPPPVTGPTPPPPVPGAGPSTPPPTPGAATTDARGAASAARNAARAERAAAREARKPSWRNVGEGKKPTPKQVDSYFDDFSAGRVDSAEAAEFSRKFPDEVAAGQARALGRAAGREASGKMDDLFDPSLVRDALAGDQVARSQIRSVLAGGLQNPGAAVGSLLGSVESAASGLSRFDDALQAGLRGVDEGAVRGVGVLRANVDELARIDDQLSKLPTEQALRDAGRGMFGIGGIKPEAVRAIKDQRESLMRSRQELVETVRSQFSGSSAPTENLLNRLNQPIDDAFSQAVKSEDIFGRLGGRPVNPQSQALINNVIGGILPDAATSAQAGRAAEGLAGALSEIDPTYLAAAAGAGGLGVGLLAGGGSGD